MKAQIAVVAMILSAALSILSIASCAANQSGGNNLAANLGYPVQLVDGSGAPLANCSGSLNVSTCDEGPGYADVTTDANGYVYSSFDYESECYMQTIYASGFICNGVCWSGSSVVGNGGVLIGVNPSPITPPPPCPSGPCPTPGPSC